MKWILVWELKERLAKAKTILLQQTASFFNFVWCFSSFFSFLFFSPNSIETRVLRKILMLFMPGGFGHSWGSQPTAWLCLLKDKLLAVSIRQLSRSYIWMKEVDMSDDSFRLNIWCLIQNSLSSHFAFGVLGQGKLV